MTEPNLAGWNHRVLRLTHKHDEITEEIFGIHEVYYDEVGNPACYGETPEPVMGESLDDLRWALERMTRALEKPLLTERDFPAPSQSPK